jgi:hypothetical protein
VGRDNGRATFHVIALVLSLPRLVQKATRPLLFAPLAGKLLVVASAERRRTKSSALACPSHRFSGDGFVASGTGTEEETRPRLAAG